MAGTKSTAYVILCYFGEPTMSDPCYLSSSLFRGNSAHGGMAPQHAAIRRTKKRAGGMTAGFQGSIRIVPPGALNYSRHGSSTGSRPTSKEKEDPPPRLAASLMTKSCARSSG